MSALAAQETWFAHVLVDEQDGNVLALVGELVEGGLDGCVVGFGVDDEEVLLAVGRVGDVLRASSVCISRSLLSGTVRRRLRGACP
jgi:hypothetical protein